MNLGMSPGFVVPDFTKLTFPGHMYIDYIRIYQDPDRINWGCDPKDFPTSALFPFTRCFLVLTHHRSGLHRDVLGSVHEPEYHIVVRYRRELPEEQVPGRVLVAVRTHQLRPALSLAFGG